MRGGGVLPGLAVASGSGVLSGLAVASGRRPVGLGRRIVAGVLPGLAVGSLVALGSAEVAGTGFPPGFPLPPGVPLPPGFPVPGSPPSASMTRLLFARARSRPPAAPAGALAATCSRIERWNWTASRARAADAPPEVVSRSMAVS